MAFIIDTTSRTIREVAYDDPALKPLKNSDPIYLNEAGDVIYEGAEGDSYCVLEGVRQPLRGPILIVVGTTEDGDDCEPKVRVKELQEGIDFGTAVSGMYYGDQIVRAVH